MKKFYIFLFSILISSLSFGQTVFINEIHYDDAGTDFNEGVEIAGPAGTDLSSYTITLYNGSNGAVYNTLALSGTIPDEGATGYGTVWFGYAANGLQNGAPDGIALDNGTLIQFLSYEGSFLGVGGIANGITSTDIGVSETGTVEGSSLQLIGTGLTYTNFSWASETTATPGTINTGQTFGTPLPSLSLSDGPPNGSTGIGNPEDVNANITFVTTNFIMSAEASTCVSDSSGDGYIVWNVKDSGNNTIDSGCIFTSNDGFEYPINNLSVNNTYTFFSELVDNTGASFVPAVTYIITLTIPGYIDVADLAELRAQTIDPNIYYRVTGEVYNTYSRSNRNQKYFQDATGGILVDDITGEISTVYNEGDGVTNIRGTLYDFNGVLELVPTPSTDWGAPTSSGNDVSSTVISISTLTNNVETYESRLVRINGVTFESAGGTFATNANTAISDGPDVFNDKMIFRSAFSEANYIGQTIPSGSNDMLVLVGEILGVPHVTARSLEELTLSTKNNIIQGFGIYPNPTSFGYVTLSSKTNAQMNVAVFDILGKQVLNKTVSNNTLDVSGLTTGIYIMKVSQDNASITKKLVIQ